MNFKRQQTSIEECDENFLASKGLKRQRDYIRVKSKSRWLLLEMKQPILTVIKQFKNKSTMSLDDSFDNEPEFVSNKEKTHSVKIKTQILEEFRRSRLENWEIRALDLLKISYTNLKLKEAQISDPIQGY